MALARRTRCSCAKALTYGPFRTGQDVTLATGRQAVLPSSAESDLLGLTLSWNFGTVQFKSITSYVSDSGDSNSTGGEEWNSTTPGAGQRTTVDTARLGFPLFSPVLATREWLRRVLRCR